MKCDKKYQEINYLATCTQFQSKSVLHPVKHLSGAFIDCDLVFILNCRLVDGET